MLTSDHAGFCLFSNALSSKQVPKMESLTIGKVFSVKQEPMEDDSLEDDEKGEYIIEDGCKFREAIQ